MKPTESQLLKKANDGMSQDNAVMPCEITHLVASETDADGMSISRLLLICPQCQDRLEPLTRKFTMKTATADENFDAVFRCVNDHFMSLMIRFNDGAAGLEIVTQQEVPLEV